jgi:hypothetical protein
MKNVLKNLTNKKIFLYLDMSNKITHLKFLNLVKPIHRDSLCDVCGGTR